MIHGDIQYENTQKKQRKTIWRLPSQSELIPTMFNMELSHFASEAFIYRGN